MHKQVKHSHRVVARKVYTMTLSLNIPIISTTHKLAVKDNYFPAQKTVTIFPLQHLIILQLTLLATNLESQRIEIMSLEVERVRIISMGRKGCMIETVQITNHH